MLRHTRWYASDRRHEQADAALAERDKRLDELTSKAESAATKASKAVMTATQAADNAGETLNRRLHSLSVYRQKRFAHRLAFLYMTGKWPPIGIHVDHVNGNPSDNRWVNLRLLTPKENQACKRLPSADRAGRGASGISGVYWDGRKSRWYVQIRRRNKVHYGGYHERLEDAEADALAIKERLKAELPAISIGGITA